MNCVLLCLPVYTLSCSNHILSVWHQSVNMMVVRMFIFLVAVLLYSHLILGLQALVINRDHSNLTYVPQDFNASVTTLSLEHNDIIVIYSGSLLRYRNLKELSLGFNPLEEIEPGTFDGNPELEVFKCYRCKLYRFPTDFGPASNSLQKIGFIGESEISQHSILCD